MPLELGLALVVTAIDGPLSVVIALAGGVGRCCFSNNAVAIGICVLGIYLGGAVELVHVVDLVRVAVDLGDAVYRAHVAAVSGDTVEIVATLGVTTFPLAPVLLFWMLMSFLWLLLLLKFLVVMLLLLLLI